MVPSIADCKASNVTVLRNAADYIHVSYTSCHFTALRPLHPRARFLSKFRSRQFDFFASIEQSPDQSDAHLTPSSRAEPDRRRFTVGRGQELRAPPPRYAALSGEWCLVRSFTLGSSALPLTLRVWSAAVCGGKGGGPAPECLPAAVLRTDAVRPRPSRRGRASAPLCRLRWVSSVTTGDVAGWAAADALGRARAGAGPGG